MEKFVAKVLSELPAGATPSLVVAKFAEAFAKVSEGFKPEAFFKEAGAPWLAAEKVAMPA